MAVYLLPIFLLRQHSTSFADGEQHGQSNLSGSGIISDGVEAGNERKDEAGADETGEERQEWEMEDEEGEFNGEGSVVPEMMTGSTRDSDVEMTTVISGKNCESSPLATKKSIQV